MTSEERRVSKLLKKAGSDENAIADIFLDAPNSVIVNKLSTLDQVAKEKVMLLFSQKVYDILKDFKQSFRNRRIQGIHKISPELAEYVIAKFN